jgi:hypothetical protein
MGSFWHRRGESAGESTDPRLTAALATANEKLQGDWSFHAVDYRFYSDELHVAVVIPQYTEPATGIMNPSIGDTLDELGRLADRGVPSADPDRVRAVVLDVFGFVGKKVVVDWHSDRTWDRAKRDKRWMDYSYYEHYQR